MAHLEIKKGNLLISEPSILNDSSFNRAIILLTEYTKNNAVGFILNRPSSFLLSDLITDLNCDFPVYEGGPVEQENLYFVHRVPELIPNSIEISNGVFWGGNFESLKIALYTKQITNTDIRFFLGYSGWGKNQLIEEIESNSWFVTKNNSKNIFLEDDSTFWRNKMVEKGGNYKLWANAPKDATLN
ncbi:MAG: YqgE/AlgH family protein [Polaribacter sp.]|jgi:putative transcriptional regulator